MFHEVIQKITRAQFFLDTVYYGLTQSYPQQAALPRGDRYMDTLD